MSNKEQIITGYASVVAASGKSITDKDILPTTKNIASLTPTDEQLKKALTGLQKAGFDCTPTATSIALKANASLFEKVFRMELDIEKHADGFYAKALTKAVIPANLENIVADIVFPEPVKLF